MQRLHWIALLVGLAAAGCGGGAEDDSDAMNGACTALEGKTFESTVQLECGLGPSGPVPCNWEIKFEARTASESTYSWRHSDVYEEDVVTCVGGKLTGKTKFGSGTYAGKWDEAAGKLTWESVDYVVKSP